MNQPTLSPVELFNLADQVETEKIEANKVAD